jgi:hypothetical protein
MVKFTLKFDETTLRFNVKEISQAKLREAWEKIRDSLYLTYSEKSFPKVRAFNVTFKDLLKINIAYRSDSKRENFFREGERIEYNKERPLQTCNAFTIDLRNGNYLIFRKTTSTWSVDADLGHELEHIYRNDFEKVYRRVELDKGQ